MALCVTWKDAAGCEVPVSLRQTRTGDECAIFQMPVADVDINGLDALWAEAGQTFGVACLSCAHVFSAPALALHFATNDMRCPVCRQGHAATLDLSSVSPDMRPALAAKVAELRAHDDAQESLDLEFDTEQVLRDLSLQVEIRWANLHSPYGPAGTTRTILGTPVSPAEHDPDAQTQQYTTHRSFQRIFNSNVRRAQVHDAEFRFCLMHPLLPFPLRSQICQGTYMCDVDIPIAQQVAEVHVARPDCNRSVLELRVNTNFLLMICAQNLMIQYQHLLA